MHCNLYKIDDLNKTIDRHGYVIIDLLSEEQLVDLRNFFKQHPLELPLDFYTTSWTNDEDYRQTSNDVIAKAMETTLHDLLVDFRILYCSYIVKKSTSDHQIGIHADWQFVEEPEHRAYNIWAPLMDVNFENAALQLIPGSHKKATTPRGPNYAFQSKQPKWLLKARLKTIPLKAGKAIFYDTRLLHGSAKNTSGQTRLAVSGLITSKAARIKHYFFPTKDGVEYDEYEVNNEFYLKNCNFINESGYWKRSVKL